VSGTQILAVQPFSVMPLSSALIAGLLFEDSDGDGVRSADEKLLKGRMLFVDADRDAVLDPGEKTTTTDSKGRYRFDSLPAGTHTIRPVLPNGWRASYSPSIGSTFTIARASQLYGREIGMTSSTRVGGSIFLDLDGDGRFSRGDRYSNTFTVFADLDRDGVFDVNEPRADVVNQSQWVFNGLRGGNYIIRVVAAGYRSTSPVDGLYRLSLRSGGERMDLSFGLKPV
jgi:hypothetical protein